MLKKLNEINPDREIISIDSPRLGKYGKLLTNCDFHDMFSITLESMTDSGPTYIGDIANLKKCKSFESLTNNIFGEIDLQAGICFGNNTKMNGMEYHKSSEVIIAVTHMILILGDLRDVVDNSWDSSLAEIFFLPAGSAVELYGGTLHLAPCRVTEEPFCSIIVLPKGTNTPLKNTVSVYDPLLFMNNKWLLCHRESPAVNRGAYVGITGENITINTV